MAREANPRAPTRVANTYTNSDECAHAPHDSNVHPDERGSESAPRADEADLPARAPPGGSRQTRDTIASVMLDPLPNQTNDDSG